MRIYITFSLIAFFLFLLFPPFFYQQPTTGLDTSYVIALHLAYKYHLVFGKDVVFTFGPLGILGNRYPISVSFFVYLLFDLYFFASFFLLLKALFKQHLSVPVVAFLFLGFSIAFYDAPFQRYFLFFLFYLFAFLKEPGKPVYGIQAAVLSILCFYYKVNLGVTGIALSLLTIGYMVIRKKLTIRAFATIVLSYAGCIWLIALFLRVDLKGYITGSWQLIDAYNDAMFLPAGNDYIVFVWLALLIMLIIASRTLWLLWATIRQKKLLQHSDELFIHGITTFVIFVFFKSGFVRVDNSHIFYFFKIGALLAGFLYLYNPAGFGKKTAAICCWAILGITTLAANTIPGNRPFYKELVRLHFLRTKIQNIQSYFKGMNNYSAALAEADRTGSSDNAFKKVIGDHSVDIIPSEISTIYFNGLHYDPRPVIQSYSAYNQYLDSLNEQKYLSPDAPDYILFSLHSIDDRLAFFDESRTRRAIFSRYRIAGEIQGELLLKKTALPKELLSQEGGEEILHARLGEEIPINNNHDLQYSRIYVNYNFAGRIRRLFYQPPSLKITLLLADSEQVTYRAILPQLKDGLFLNKYIDTRQEFQLLMQSGGHSIADIRKIRIGETSGNSGFDGNIKMVNTWYTFPYKPEPERKADSLGVVQIIKELNKYHPVLIDPSSYQQDSCRCWIENVKAYSPLIRIQGWAFREKDDNESNIVKVVLRSGDKVYELPSEQQRRQDLIAYFKRKDILMGGITASVSRSQLPPGKYQLGITIYNVPSGKKWIWYTDRQLSIYGQ